MSAKSLSPTGLRNRASQSVGVLSADGLRATLVRCVRHVESPRARRLLDLLGQDVVRAVEPRSATELVRTQYQMRCRLDRALESEVVVRDFRAADDSAGLRVVFQEAFAWLPDGGAAMNAALCTEQGLDLDQERLLVHESARGIDGFCWVKRRQDEPALGEVYGLAVAPGSVGRGLGRQLLRAGLQQLQRFGSDTAVLYVDATNLRAVCLYVSEGFVVHRLERQFATEAPLVEAPMVPAGS